MQKEITYLDLFSGTGGFALGFLSAGYVFKRHYFSEIDKPAIANYTFNFKNAEHIGDIKKIKNKKIERPDLITFGSPCQDISLAGQRKGLKGERSGLFFEAVQLVGKYKPRVFIIENVKGLFSSNQGRDFETVLKTLANLGLYDIEWQLLNTAWVLPQNRERIYIVGHLRNERRSQIFPFCQSPRLLEAGSQTREVSLNTASSITADYHKGVHARGETYIVKLRVPEATNKGYAIATTGDSVNLNNLGSRFKCGRIGRGTALTLTSQIQQYTLRQGKVRKLTPRECERLQGFPDDWTRYGIFENKIKEISDTQRYKMLGNAVTVALVRQIAKKLLLNNG